VGVERRPRGGLEQDIFAVLAAAGRPMTSGEVRDALDADLAYTTVMTVLTRLCDKGAVARERAGRAYAYAALTDSADVTARHMQRLLDGDDDRAAVLTRFVDALSPADEQLLLDLLRRAGHAEDDR
jgi:predicted transcriptional regulator